MEATPVVPPAAITRPYKPNTWIYLFDITWNFDLAEWYSNLLKSQGKYKLHLAEYSSCNVQLYQNTNVFVIIGLHHNAGHPQLMGRNM